MKRTEDHMWLAELARIEGERRRLQGSSAGEIEGHINRTLMIARGQKARAFELRAATSLARLWEEQGRSAEARDLLAPIYG